MCDDSSRQGGKETGVSQVEVTPEMRAAGLAVIEDCLTIYDQSYLAEAVYIAMETARRTQSARL